MKQGRMIGIGFAAVNAVLAAVCIILYIRTDRTAPEFAFQAVSMVYREGMDQEALLTGITARDGRDGDVTDRVVVEKATEDREAGSVVVFYAVSDSSGNVARASRVFPASFGGLDGSETEAVTGGFLSAGIDADLTDMPEGSDGSAGEYNAGTVMAESGMAESSEGGDVQDAGTETPSPTQTPSPASAATPEPAAAQTPSQAPRQPDPTPDPSAPVLTLKVSEVTVSAGQGPAWVDIIGVLSDDKDGYETLFRNLSVSKYDRNKAGTYQVSVYTEDSDGNRSQTIPLTIIVQ